MDPLSLPARVWIKTRETWQTHRLQYWAPANNVRGPVGQIYTDQREQYGDDLGFSDILAPRRVEHRGSDEDAHQQAISDAAATADHHAEIEAEQEIEAERKAITEARAAVHALAVDLRNTPALPVALCLTTTEAIKTRRKRGTYPRADR